MKVFSVLLFCAISNSALAFVGSNDSWTDILATHSVSLIYQDNLGGIDIRNACLTEKEIRTINPIKHCEKLVPVKAGENKDKYTNWVCEKWIEGSYSYPRTVVMNYCTDWGKDYDQNLSCRREEKRPVTVPQIIKVRVIQTQGSYSTYPGFQKLFTLPSCKN